MSIAYTYPPTYLPFPVSISNEATRHSSCVWDGIFLHILVWKFL